MIIASCRYKMDAVEIPSEMIGQHYASLKVKLESTAMWIPGADEKIVYEISVYS